MLTVDWKTTFRKETILPPAEKFTIIKVHISTRFHRSGLTMSITSCSCCRWTAAFTLYIILPEHYGFKATTAAHFPQNHDYKKKRIYSKGKNWHSDVCALSNGIHWMTKFIYVRTCICSPAPSQSSFCAFMKALPFDLRRSLIPR